MYISPSYIFAIRKEAYDIHWPPVSILIITKRRREALISVLNSISSVDYPQDKMQVVVLEETSSPLDKLPEGIEYHTIPERNLGFGYARNAALTHAGHEIVVFLDDDCIVTTGWLKELVRPFVEDSKIGAVAGSILVPDCGPIGECENIIGFPGGGLKYIHEAEDRIVSRPTFSTCNCAIRKYMITLAGHFMEALRYGGEDQNLSEKIRKNSSIVFNPRAVVRHAPRDSFKRVFLWFFRRGQAELYSEILSGSRGLFVIKTVKNSFLLRALGVAALSFLPQIPFWIFPLFLAIYYFFLLFRFRWSRQYYGAWKTFLLVPFVRWTMDLGRDIGIFVELAKLRHKQHGSAVTERSG